MTKIILLAVCLSGCLDGGPPGVPGAAFRPLRAGKALRVKTAKAVQAITVSSAPVDKFSADVVYDDVGDFIENTTSDSPSGKGMVLAYAYADNVYLTVDEDGKGAIQQTFSLSASVHPGSVATEEADRGPFVGQTTAASGDDPAFLPPQSVEALKDDYESWKTSL